MNDEDASANVPYSWKVVLGATIIDKRKLLEREPGQHYDTVPRLRNTEEQLRGFETAQGEPLPEVLRGFLLHADGWGGVWLGLGLFGLAELRGQDNGAPARILLDRYEASGVLAAAGLALSNLMPVAAGAPQHLVVLSRDTGEVVWFDDGRLRERFDDFAMFVFELMNLHRDRLEALDK